MYSYVCFGRYGMVDYGCDTCFLRTASIHTTVKGYLWALLHWLEKVLNLLLLPSLHSLRVVGALSTTRCYISKTKITKHLWLSWGQHEALGILPLRNIRLQYLQVCKRYKRRSRQTIFIYNVWKLLKRLHR